MGVLCAPVQYMYMIHESVIEREEERERGEEILTNQNYDGATWNQEKKTIKLQLFQIWIRKAEA